MFRPRAIVVQIRMYFSVDGKNWRELICGAGCHVDVVLHTEPTDVDAKLSTRSTITKRLQFNTCITCILSNMYRRVNVRCIRKAQTHISIRSLGLVAAAATFGQSDG